MAIAASACAMLYESHDRLKVNPSFCRLTLSGALKCRLRSVLVPRSKSPGDLARPGLGVDQVAAAAGCQGRQLREDGVYGTLQAGFGG